MTELATIPSLVEVQSKKLKLESLQILRGLAALFVVCRHITGSNLFYFHNDLLGGVFRPGWNSIDFFFTLSGFLFGYIHYKDVGNKEKVPSFFIKRFIRIYPIYWAASIISFIFFLATAPEIVDIGHVVKSFLLIPQEEVPILGVAWSLYYEVVFYFIFGIYMLGGKYVMKIGFLIHLSLIFLQFMSPNIFHSSFLLSFVSSPYYLEFIIGFLGGLIALSFDNEKLMQCRFHLLFGGVSSFATVKYYSLSNYIYSDDFFLTRFGFAISITLIIMALINFSISSTNRMVIPFIHLGNASYSLYLWHPIVLALFFKLFREMAGNEYRILRTSGLYCFSFLTLLISIWVGIVVYEKLETPLSKSLRNRLLK